MKVAGALLLDVRARSFFGGVAHVQVEDASRADAAARVIATLRIDGIVHEEGAAERIQFALECPEAPDGKPLAIRAWIDQPPPGQFTSERIAVGKQPGELLLSLSAIDIKESRP